MQGDAAFLAAAVFAVAVQRVPAAGKLYPDLMGAPGVQGDLGKAVLPCRGKDAVFQHRLPHPLAGTADREHPALAAVLEQVVPQHSGGGQLRIRRTGEDRAVLLDELRRGGFALGAAVLHGVGVLTLGDLTAQGGGSCRGAGIDHQPGHTGVQPVHHPHKGIRCVPVRAQRGGHALLAGKPGGLVQHHKGGVLV